MKTNNFFGDKMFYKLKAVIGGQTTIAAGQTFTRAGPFQLNDGVQFFNRFGPAPGQQIASQNFQQYKLRGLKLKTTYWPLAPNVQPICAWTMAAQQTTALGALTPDINTVPEQRWSKYRVLSFPGQGCRPTTMTSYYSVGKVWGPDRTELNSVNFTSSTSLVSPWYNTPVAGPFYDEGIFIMNGFPAAVPAVVAYKTEATGYFQYWAKRPLTA